MRLIKTLLCGVAVALSGCVSLLPDAAPADVIYRLGAINEGVPQSPLAKVIRIDRPRASSAFQGKDIVVPDMVQGSFVNLLGQRAGLVGVIPSSGARTDTLMLSCIIL